VAIPVSGKGDKDDVLGDGGYIDPATGQYVPGAFNDQINIPNSSPSQGDIDKANKALKAEQAKGNKAKSSIDAANAQIKQLQQMLKNKKLNAAAKAGLQKRIAQQQAIVQAQTKLQQASLKAQVPLQNKVYEVTGQYDKLLSGANRDAFAALKSLFNGYGLGSLAGKIYDYVKQGYGADTISILLQDTPEYKARFAGNEDRAKKGLAVLSPAEYLATEQAYRQIMQEAGLPKGFYDNAADFRQFIASDISPTEIKGRVDLASQKLFQANPDAIKALQQLYGVDKSMLTAYYLDQKRALPLLQKQAQAADFGAEALKRGLTLDRGDLEDFVTSGLSLQQVSSGFQAVAEALPNIQAIAARFGDSSFSQQELERDLVGGQTNSTGDTRRRRLASQERALFQGSGGATPGGLGQGYQAV